MSRGKRWSYVYGVLAGACDGMTGVMLVLAPSFTLKLMNIDALPTEPIYMRFIGIFVMSVGCSYFLPFFVKGYGRDMGMAHVLGFTAFIRICVATFVTLSVVMHALVPGWLMVVFTDTTFAAIQLGILKTGVLSATHDT